MKKKNKSTLKGTGVSKGEQPLKTSFRLSSKCYFLTYKGISDSGEKITKQDLANYLLNQNKNDIKKRPEKYLICEQMYDSGEPHFHVILIYPTRKQIVTHYFYDYLGIHPNIQTMRNMKAALEYVYKEDTNPVTNMDILQQRRLARAKDSSSLYDFLYDQMIKDPFNFDSVKYCTCHNLTKQIYKANYTKAINLLKQVQPAYCNQILADCPGIRLITRQLIEERLTSDQLKTYDSWSGYSRCVYYLNQIPNYGFRRYSKTMNLLITGPKNIGKSALVWQQYPRPEQNPLSTYCSIYPMGMRDWFPDYKSQVYHVIYWNEAKLTSYPYDTILQILDGSPVMLPAKGGGHKKVDNPLVIMTSNMTLDEMIKQKFSYNKQYQKMARENLSARIENIVVPPGLNLFLLQKLLAPNSLLSIRSPFTSA